MSDRFLEDLLVTARRAADAAAAVHSAWAKRIDVRDADSKSFSDFVSRVDVEAQDAALAVIRSARTGDAVMAEEAGLASVQLPSDATPIWIVDPLDGTTNFLHDHPNHCASVAVAIEGRVVAGCVSSAPTRERWWARAGGGAWRNGAPIRTSSIRDLEGALVATGFTFQGGGQVERFGREIAAVRGVGAGIRRGGSAAMDLCYVADGRFEAYWETFLNTWDFAAGILVVEEAGGRVRRRDGSAFDLQPGSMVASNSEDIEARLLSVLSGA